VGARYGKRLTEELRVLSVVLKPLRCLVCMVGSLVVRWYGVKYVTITNEGKAENNICMNGESLLKQQVMTALVAGEEAGSKEGTSGAPRHCRIKELTDYRRGV